VDRNFGDCLVPCVLQNLGPACPCRHRERARQHFDLLSSWSTAMSLRRLSRSGGLWTTRGASSRCSESISNLAGNRCPKIRASEALYRIAMVQRTGEKWPIGERDGQTRRPRGPELIAKITPSLGPTKGASRTEKYHLLRHWRTERDSNSRYASLRTGD